MAITDFLPQANGYVRIRLVDGSVHTGRFRTDILTDKALSVYFFGDVRDLSLSISEIDTVDPLEDLKLAS